MRRKYVPNASSDGRRLGHARSSFEVRETKIQAWAAVPRLGVENPARRLAGFCNKWKREKTAPKVYIDKDGDFIAENTIFIDEEVSKDYIKNNFILLSTVAMKSFFELNRRLNAEYDDYAALITTTTRTTGSTSSTPTTGPAATATKRTISRTRRFSIGRRVVNMPRYPKRPTFAKRQQLGVFILFNYFFKNYTTH